MKNLKFFLSIAWSFMVLTSFGVHAAQTRRWRARVVPVAFDQSKGSWSVLLGHNVNEYWNDFSYETRRGQTAAQAAAAALKDQTSGVYRIDLTGVPWERNSATGDIFHFARVKYTPGRELYQKARNRVKDNFVWISEDDLMGSQVVSRPHHKQMVNVSHGFLQFFQNVWPSIKNKLTTVQPVSQKKMDPDSWFNISSAIYFYEKNKPYYEFTNFYDGNPIKIDGRMWPTSEHYYQAMKFTDYNMQEKVRKAATPRQAFTIGQTGTVRSDWKKISRDVMVKAVRTKFTNDAHLKKLLLKTDDRILVENAGKNDAFYGAGADGKGENHLGQILMHVRAELVGDIPTGAKYVPRNPGYYQRKVLGKKGAVAKQLVKKSKPLPKEQVQKPHDDTGTYMDWFRDLFKRWGLL